MADGGKRVLLAEDDKAISNAMKLKLTTSGFDVDTAYNGQEAIDKVAGGGFDLMLMDLIMPDMNGFAVLEQLRDKGNQIPVMVLSNLGQEEDKAKAKELGAVDYYVKSDISLSDVVSKIQEILQQ